MSNREGQQHHACRYAKMIDECEHLASKEQKILEIAAILHDIACPLCREKYGNTDGKRQEEEGIPLVYSFFKGTGKGQEIVERTAYLIFRQHSIMSKQRSNKKGEYIR